MGPVLHVSLLGHFQLDYAGCVVNTVKTARLQSLLAFILLHRKEPISRLQLAALFWPETSESQARTNLRNLLHQLRQALPCLDDFLYSDAYALLWRKDASYELDTEAFEALLSVEPGKLVPRKCLELAVEIYHGDLLPGCYDDWVIPIRERLHSVFLSALEALAMMAEGAREYLLALTYANRQVQADPLHPGANRQLIRLHALLGDRSSALKSYLAYSRLLEEELGAKPDPETEELYNRLQRAWEIPQERTATERSPLVDRKAEWRRLQAIWQASYLRNAQLVFITGEAGIGKTRLVEELAFWAKQQGIVANTAFCYPAEGSLPYAPVVSWLRAQPLPPVDKIWLAELARLLPEIRKNFPGLSWGEPFQETWQRQHLFETLARTLLGRKRAQLLILEDIHWCDQDTLEWLHFLLRFDPTAQLLIVATVRTGEILPDHPLAILQTALRAEGRYTELELNPLTEVDTVQLASQVARGISGEALSSEASVRIYREAEGNPLFVVEMVRLENTTPNEDPADHRSLAKSERAQAVLTRRIGKLSLDAREITSLSAVIGREFSLEVLRKASEEEDKAIVHAIDEMLQLHIIQEIAPEKYNFTHDRLRQAALDGLSSAHRRLLHRHVAEALLCAEEDLPCPRDAEIANHYEHAGMLLQAVHHFRQAADSAARIFSIADALNLQQHTINLAENIIPGEPNSISFDEYALMLEKMGDLLALDGKHAQAQACFERALSQPFSPPGLWRSQVYRKISAVLVPQYQHLKARVALDQAEESLRLPDGGGSKWERQEWIEIQLARSQLFYWGNYPDQMDAIIHEIGAKVEAEGRIDQQINFLSQVCQSRIRHERYRLSEETVNISRHRLKLTEGLADPYELAVAQFQFGFMLLWHGDLEEAREWLITGYKSTARIGARLWQLRSLAYLSIVNRKLGDLEMLSAHLQELLDLANTIEEYTYQGIGLANQAWLAWKMGDVARAEQFCRSAKDTWDKSGGNTFHSLVEWILMAMAVARRDLTQANGCAQALLDPNPLYQPIEEPMAGLLRLALSASVAKDADAAYNLFTQAIEQARIAREL